jgi:hypothetical protein
MTDEDLHQIIMDNMKNSGIEEAIREFIKREDQELLAQESWCWGLVAEFYGDLKDFPGRLVELITSEVHDRTKRNKPKLEKELIHRIKVEKIDERNQRQKYKRREDQRAEDKVIGEYTVLSNPPNPEYLSMEEMAERFVFIDTGSWVAILPEEENGERCSVLALGDVHNKYAACKELDENGNEQKRSRLWLAGDVRKSVFDIACSIGMPRFLRRNGKPLVNIWTPRIRGEVPELDYLRCVKKFVDHTRFLIPDEADYELFMDWLAHCEQLPQELPHYGWLMWTRSKGVGRNWLSGALARVWPGEAAMNLDLASLLNGNFNDELANRRFANVDEIHLGGIKSLHSSTQKLKQMMTSDTLHINIKSGKKFECDNRIRWLLFSNHSDAMPVETGDRRLAVVRNPSEIKSVAYYKEMYAVRSLACFGDAIGLWLSQRDISKFEPGAPPPLSESKREVIEDGQSDTYRDAALYLAEWPTRIFVFRDMAAMCGIDPGNATGRKHLTHCLKELGCDRLKGKPTVAGRRETLYLMLEPQVGGDLPPKTELDPAGQVAKYRASEWWESTQPHRESSF